MTSNDLNNFSNNMPTNKVIANQYPIRQLNLYFPNSISPKLNIINIDNFSSIYFEIKTEEGHYSLISVISTGNQTSSKEIAKFKTENEAKLALKDTCLSLEKTSQSETRSMWTIGGIVLAVCLLAFGFNAYKNKSNQPVEKVNETKTQQGPILPNPGGLQIPEGAILPPNGVNAQSLPPPASNAEIDNIIEQLQQAKQLQDKFKNAQGGQPEQQQPPPQEQQQQLSPADQFLNGLK